MSERIEKEVVDVEKSEKYSKIVNGDKATKCNVERFYDCFHYNIDSEKYIDGPHGEILAETRVGLCDLTEMPCLNAAVDLSSMMLD